MNLSKYTKPKIEELKDLLNLTEDEERVFNLLAKKKTITEISGKLMMSESTVSRRIRSIRDKMNSLGNPW